MILVIVCSSLGWVFLIILAIPAHMGGGCLRGTLYLPGARERGGLLTPEFVKSAPQ